MILSCPVMAVDESDGGRHRILLRDYLVAHYNELVRYLTRRLGSPDFARECLHDAWLRLGDERDVGAVSNPGAYVSRMAYHLALDRLRVDERTRYLAWDDEDSLHDLPDNGPRPDECVAAREVLQTLIRAIERLPRQRREIFLAVRVEQIAQCDVATRYGMSLRRVATELRKAHQYCELELRAA